MRNIFIVWPIHNSQASAMKLTEKQHAIAITLYIISMMWIKYIKHIIVCNKVKRWTLQISEKKIVPKFTERDISLRRPHLSLDALRWWWLCRRRNKSYRLSRFEHSFIFIGNKCVLNIQQHIGIWKEGNWRSLPLSFSLALHTNRFQDCMGEARCRKRTKKK